MNRQTDQAGRSRLPQSEDLIGIRFVVAPRYDGWRLDHFVQAEIPRLARSRIQKMIRAQADFGCNTLRPATRVRAGQILILFRPAPNEEDIPRHFDILFEDEAMMAINKPAGLPVHATARFLRNTLTAILREHFPSNTPTLAHRLDRETSGVLLLAKSRSADSALKQAFERRLMRKQYIAVIKGVPPWPSGEGIVDTPISRESPGAISIQRAIDPKGQPARTEVRLLARVGGFSLVEAQPLTGRQHQIRIHLASVGCPIIGDKLYGPDPSLMLEYLETGWTTRLQQQLLLPRHALHAARITLPHPLSGEELTIEAPLAPDLAQFIAEQQATHQSSRAIGSPVCA